MPQSGLIGRHHWKLVRDDLKKSLKEIDPHATRVLQIFSLKKYTMTQFGRASRLFLFSCDCFPKDAWKPQWCVSEEPSKSHNLSACSYTLYDDLPRHYSISMKCLYICRSLYICLKTFIFVQQHLILISSEDLNAELSPILESTFCWELSVF